MRISRSGKSTPSCRNHTAACIPNGPSSESSFRSCRNPRLYTRYYGVQSINGFRAQVYGAVVSRACLNDSFLRETHALVMLRSILFVASALTAILAVGASASRINPFTVSKRQQPVCDINGEMPTATAPRENVLGAHNSRGQPRRLGSPPLRCNTQPRGPRKGGADGQLRLLDRHASY